MKIKSITIIFIIYFVLSLTFLLKVEKEKKNLSILNKDLLYKIDSLSNIYTKIEYKPIIVEKNKKIKLGEDYISNIYLSQIPINKLPEVSVGKVDNGNINKQSLIKLKFNKKFNTFIYKITPKKVGKYNWGGIITYYNYANQKKELYFMNEFEVKK